MSLKQMFARILCGFSAFALCAPFAGAQNAPAWVQDAAKAYPERDWVIGAAEAPDRRQAESAARSALAKAFKVDVKSVTNAMQSFSQSLSGGKSSYAQNQSLKSQINTSSDVDGLMGVLLDAWAAPNGTVYACARMNRKDGAATYAAIIRQNDKTIATLVDGASAADAPFAAYELLNFAYSIAALTDNYLNILSVLDSNARRSVAINYGNAAAVRALAMNAASGIVINLEVRVRDIAGLQTLDAERIAKPFQQVFTKRRFKTSVTNTDAPYTLAVDFTLDTVDLAGNPNKFTRYVLKAALLDRRGDEVMSFQDSKRSGHTSISEAAQRSIRDAEEAIAGAGFAKAFDAYLGSLLQ
ncbi:hypothetical protein [Treponema endosymbiont of Eucomonympha sp.]|uniref:hypothetical protein n=1 Tax=Treponema endosymbiont of Eucomonympha sp. TaxID=1580831 RepID=UPI000A8ED760|nr:hypothetical protein [Treponema endosymbiont of Eucomonympha sp.]